MTATPAAAPLLEARGLSFRRQDEPVFAPMDFQLHAGELALVEGDNGSGKTTLLRMLAGLLHVGEGELHWRGAPLQRDATVGEILFLGHQLGLKADFSPRENLRVAVEVTQGLKLKLFRSRQKARETEERVDELLDMGHLADKADRHVGELSHGDQRSTEIMMALALKPKLLLLDEPAAGMGSQETYDTALLIRRLHRTQKLTIVLVEHDMRVIFNLADRITVLTEGEVLERGTPDEIAASEKVQVAYLGETHEGA